MATITDLQDEVFGVFRCLWEELCQGRITPRQPGSRFRRRQNHRNRRPPGLLLRLGSCGRRRAEADVAAGQRRIAVVLQSIQCGAVLYERKLRPLHMRGHQCNGVLHSLRLALELFPPQILRSLALFPQNSPVFVDCDPIERRYKVATAYGSIVVPIEYGHQGIQFGGS